MARPLFRRSARRPAERTIRNPVAPRSIVGGVEQLECRKVLATFMVASAADAGPQTLRDAILKANATPGPDVIQFAIPAAANSPVITPAAPLPTITDSLSIDARSQPGLSLDGTTLARTRAASFDGLQFSPTAVNSSVAGLRLTGFRGTAIVAAANGFQLLGSSLTNNDTGLALKSVANGRIGTGSNGNSFTTNTCGLKATGTCSGTVITATSFSDNGAGASLDSAAGLTLGGTEKTLATYTFTSVAAGGSDASQGAPSASGLTADSAGNLYGVTQIGNGTVFRIANDATRTRTTLVSFQGSNGSMPVGPLTLDAAGNIYGVTQSGGNNGMGTVFKIANDGKNTLTTLTAFGGTTWPGAMGGLALDASGNLYGSLRSGGASGLGTVFQVSTGSQPRLTTLATFAGGNGSFPNGGLAVDALGNVYGTTSGGTGNATGGTIFRIANDAGRTLSTLVTFTGANGYRPQAGLTADAAGNLYGTRYHGVFAPNHKLRRAITALAIGNVGKRQEAVAGGHRDDGYATEGCCDANPSHKPRSHDTSRIAWAKLMARVGEEFPLACPTCGGDIRLIAFITDPGPIRKILTHLGEPLEPPPVSPARGPPTDWGELVQIHDDRDVFQASPDELPAIDIHRL